ncbi:MAG: ubiquitin-like domain-containing protein [Bacillota bacterium]
MNKQRSTPPGVSTFRPGLTVLSLVMLVIVAGAIMGFTLSRKTVALVDDGKEVAIKTRASDVKEFLDQQKVVLGPHDRVLPEPGEKLVEGARVVVKRAHSITLLADSEKTDFYSTGETVGDVLKEKNVALGGEDIVSPGADEKITGDTRISVVRVSTETETERIAVACDTRRIPNPDMARGISRTVSRGRDGEELLTWKVTYHDRQEVSRGLVNREILSQPVDKVVEVGTAQTVSRGGQSIRFREAMDAVATAYTYTGYNTASGTAPEYGTVAVDPSVIPFGTRMYIDGYGYATALDRGGAIKGNRIDVFLESAAEAYSWGVRRVRVYILD